MHIYLCPNCEKNWQENYCPECGTPIETASAGKSSWDSSYATCPAMTPMNPVRYLYYNTEVHGGIGALLFLPVIVAFACIARWWISALVFLALFLWVGFTLCRICYYNRRNYRDAALSAAMVVSTKPLEFIAIADMSFDDDTPAYAVKRIRIGQLPKHPQEIGTLFPCVSTFQEGEHPDRWGDFHPQPLSFGTGDMDLINNRMRKLGIAPFEKLQHAYAEGNYPDQADQLIWLSEDDLRP